jgi:hypothetical protein
MVRSGVIGVLVLAASLVPLSSPRAKSICELAVTADPPELAAGRRQARIRVTTGGAAPRFQVSAGELKNVRREIGAVFVADYTRPTVVTPVVWVVATAEGGSCGYLPIRLRPAESTRPDANPPAALVIAPGSVKADQEQEVFAYAFALDGSGAPRSGPAPVFAVTSGEVSEAEAIGPGAWRVRWTVPAGDTQPVQVTARFGDALTLSSSLQRLPGPVADIQVEFDRKRAVVGDPKPVTVTVRARDSVGNPADAEIAVDVDGGELSQLVREAEGVYRATLPVPSALGRDPSIFVLARSGIASGNATLFLSANAPSRIELDAPNSVQADGATSYYVTVKVSDAYGNPADEIPEAQSLGAILGQPRQLGPGVWTFDYRPKRVALEAEDVVDVRAGSSTASRSVRLVPPTFNFTVGPKLGVAVVSGNAQLAYGGEIAAWKLLGSQQFGLVLDVDRWSRSASSTVVVDPIGNVDRVEEQSYLPITLSAGWRFGLSQRLMLSLAVGGGLTRISSSADLKQISQQLSESKWVTTVSVAASLGLRAWRGYTFIELRWLPMSDPGFTTLSGSISPILLQVGYRFDVG